MKVIYLVLLIFTLLELLNIIILYFFPDSTKGNGIAIFKQYETLKKDEYSASLIAYLVNWVANSKLIFIALLVVILLTGSEETILYSVVVLTISILAFYWRMYPIIKSIGKKGGLVEKNYAQKLAITIAFFVGMFVIALLFYILSQ